MSISDKHYDYITEVIYGDEFTKDDKQNIKKKFKPVSEEKSGFSIREPSHACRFIDSYTGLIDEIEKMYIVNGTLRSSIQKYRNENDSFIKQNMTEQYHNLVQEHDNLRKEYKLLKDDKIEDYNTHPYCKKLLDENNRIKNDIIDVKNEYAKKNKSLNDKLEYLDKSRKEYIEGKEKLEEDFEKKKSSFIKKAKQENKDEESVKMKALKDELASLKKKQSKLEKKNKALKKDNKKLRIQVAEMSSDDSDSDSDNDSD